MSSHTRANKKNPTRSFSATRFTTRGRAAINPRWAPAACLAAALVAAEARASIADFDALPEGAIGTNFTTGGITFFDLDDRAGGFPVTFTCERADGTISNPGFSAPNALGFGSWVPGPGAAFSQVGSFSFTTGTVQTFASIDVFEWLSPAGNTISLEAFLGATLVDRTTVVIPGNGQINHWQLSISGTSFDRLRINGGGPASNGTFIGLVDNVVVVPAPASVLALLALGLHRRRR